MSNIQKKCSVISFEIKNRQELKEEIIKTLDKLILTERLITVITTSPITDQEFIEQMHELNYKIKSLNNLKSIENSASGESLQLINNIKIKCLFRLNNFFMEQFNLILADPSNASNIKCNLISHRYLIDFVRHHDEIMFEQIICIYIRTSRKIANSSYKIYFTKLFEAIDRNSLVDNLIGNIKKRPSKTEQSYMLGIRSALISTEIESKVIKLEAGVDKHLNDSMIEVKKTFHNSLEILKHSYLNYLIDVSWNRFYTVIRNNVESISSITALTCSSYEECHIITRRVSGVLSAFHSVITDFEPNKLVLIFSQFLQEWQTFIIAQASVFDSRKHQLVYQIINYNVVLNMIMAQSLIPIITDDVKIDSIHEASAKLSIEFIDDLRKKYKTMINVCFSIILDYYKEYTELLLKHYPNVVSKLNAKGKLIDVQQILIEIKKYR
ncbi:hypothetical protein HZS_5453 [Henneguya salminicola]|nr:hypothetical protein HZS_5453 [Henneguya salminicola]